MNKTIEVATHMKNEVNRVLLEELKHLHPQLLHFVGKKIYKVDGSHTSTFDPLYLIRDANPLPGGQVDRHSTLLRQSGEYLKLEVSLCFRGGKYEDKSYYCMYESASVHFIGKVVLQMLREVNDLGTIIKANQLDTVIKSDEQQEILNQYSIAKKQLRDLENKFLLEHTFLQYA